MLEYQKMEKRHIVKIVQALVVTSVIAYFAGYCKETRVEHQNRQHRSANVQAIIPSTVS